MISKTSNSLGLIVAIDTRYPRNPVSAYSGQCGERVTKHADGTLTPYAMMHDDLQALYDAHCEQRRGPSTAAG